MILRPMDNFSGNGVLRGTITALDDLGDPLGWEAFGNWSDPAFREKSVKGLANEMGIELDRARAGIGQAMREARRKAGVPDPNQPPEPPTHDLRPIEVNRRHLRDIAHDTWEVIQSANKPNPQFFFFGNSLCDLTRGAQGPAVRVLNLQSLRNRLTRLADYISIDKYGEERPDRPPRDLLEDILVQDLPPVPLLRGMVRGPVCRKNGSIVVEEGYDSETGFYLAPGELQLPPISQNPSDGDLLEARRLVVDELLIDFPFASRADLAHAVAELLTLPARQIIDGPTPLFCNEAPTPGSGKDLLADIVSIIHTGGPSSAMTEGRDDEEWRKRLTAKLMTSPSIILIDNIKRKLDSGALSAALERPIWEDRFLSASRMITVPVTCVWVCTANNPSFSDEIARRMVRVRIDPAVERPWERANFKYPNLRQWVRDNRGQLLWALLTLVRAWAVRGMPKARVAFGSFESWAENLGGILQVADIPGFLENREDVYAQATSEAEGLRDFLATWWETYGDEQSVGVDALFNLAREKLLLHGVRSGRTDQGARVAMGRLLSTCRDRVIGEYRVRQVRVGRRGTYQYRLELSSGQGPLSLNNENVEKFSTIEILPENSPASPALSANFAGDAGDWVAGDYYPRHDPRHHPRQTPEHEQSNRPRTDAGDAGDFPCPDFCDICQHLVIETDIYRYTETGVVCQSCGGEEEPPHGKGS